MQTYLSQPIEGLKISMFRALFGIVLFLQALYFYLNDFINADVLDPVMHFPYPGLSFIKVLDPWLMNSLLVLLFISSIAIVFGFRSRLFSFIYLLSFSYMWLIDKGYFNNHYYLISLLLLLYTFIHSDGYFSFFNSSKRNNRLWELRVLQFQIALVLVYAGLNKLNYWWLIKHEPVHHILEAKAKISSNPMWTSAILENTMVWGGLLFDLFIIPLLLWKKTQKWAILLVFIFNGLNTWVFYDIGEIGIFPLLMITTTVLFMDENLLRRGLKRLGFRLKADNNLEESSESSIIMKPLYYFIMVYAPIQLLLPLRHHFYEGNVDYTGEGQRFSWRMKSVYKDFSIAFILKDEERGISAKLDPRSVLTVKQYTNLGYYPELIIPVAENLRKTALEKGINDPKIFVDYKVGFMGMEQKEIVDSELELKGLKYNVFRHSEWILPLELE